MHEKAIKYEFQNLFVMYFFAIEIFFFFNYGSLKNYFKYSFHYS